MERQAGHTSAVGVDIVDEETLGSDRQKPALADKQSAAVTRVIWKKQNMPRDDDTDEKTDSTDDREDGEDGGNVASAQQDHGQQAKLGGKHMKATGRRRSTAKSLPVVSEIESVKAENQKTVGKKRVWIADKIEESGPIAQGVEQTHAAPPAKKGRSTKGPSTLQEKPCGTCAAAGVACYAASGAACDLCHKRKVRCSKQT
jgi:hypothetical protein